MLGTFEKSIDLPEEISVLQFLENLKIEFPALNKLNALRVAVNEEYAEENLVLHHKDEVVLIPPVSGG